MVLKEALFGKGDLGGAFKLPYTSLQTLLVYVVKLSGTDVLLHQAV